MLYILPVEADGKKVVLAYGEYPPYYGKDLKNKGPIAEIIVKAYKEVGYEVTLIYIHAWKRRVEDIKQGIYDGLFSMWYRKEREECFVFSDALPPNEIGFYKRKEMNLTFNTYEDLKGYKIGVTRGFSYPPEFKRENLDIEEVNHVKQNIGKLILKRIDLAVTDRGVGMHILKNEYPQDVNNVTWVNPPVEVIYQHLVISKKTKDFQNKLNDFNVGLKILLKRGEINNIMKKHGFNLNK